MPTTHEIAREYATPIEGLAPIAEILTVECTCGEEWKTYCADRAASSKELASEHAVHAATADDAETSWTITDSLHPDCTGCAELKESAVIHARVTGSIGATYTAHNHSCTVTRKPTAPQEAPSAAQPTEDPTGLASGDDKAAEDFSRPETLKWANDFTRALAVVIEGHEDDDTAEAIEWLHAHESDSFLWDMINKFTGSIQDMARDERKES
jgi:hypothetical protein